MAPTVYDRYRKGCRMRKINSRYGWMAWTIAGVLTLAAAVALSASAVVGSGWARQYLLQKIEAASGRRLHAETLTMRLTPALRIDAARLGLSNPGDGDASDLI